MDKLFASLLVKLFTESFVSKLLVYALAAIAKSTSNMLDDKIVQAVADALGVEI